MGDVLPMRRLWSVNALANAFGKNWNGTRQALSGVPPDGQISGHDAWYLATAAPYLCQPVIDGELQHLRPNDRLHWVKSERELMQLRREYGELVAVDEVREQLADIIKATVIALDTLPDVLERTSGLTAVQAERMAREIDGFREQLFHAFSAHIA